MLEDIWDSIVDGFDYLIHFEWIVDFKDAIVDTFSNIPEWFTLDSPLFNLWFWVFYGFCLVGVWILPSALKLQDWLLWQKLVLSVAFFIVCFLMVNYFKSD